MFLRIVECNRISKGTIRLIWENWLILFSQCITLLLKAEGFVRQEQDAYGSVNIQFYCGKLVHRSGLCQVLSFYECYPLENIKFSTLLNV